MTVHFEIGFQVMDELSIRFAENDSFCRRRIVLTSPWPESLLDFERAWRRLPASAGLTVVELPGFGRPEEPPDCFCPYR